MPRFNLILNLPGFSIKKVSGYHPIVIDVHYYRIPRCAHCQSKRVRKKDSFMRTVKHELYGPRRTVLRFKAYKLFCNDCRRYGNQQFPGIGKHQRATDRLKAQVFRQHTEGVSQKQLAGNHKMGKATIERWYHKRYQRESQERDSKQCPTVLGIDEHSFSRKQGFATTLCDLRNNKVFDIVKGRSETDLASYLNALPGKHRVKVVCIDLSSTYRHIVKKYFPNAKIVADRFHVIRLMQHQCMMTYRELAAHIKHNRSILALLRTKPQNLSDKKIIRRDDFLKKHPAIAAIYHFQQQLHQLLMEKTCNKHYCKTLAPKLLDMIAALKQSPFNPKTAVKREFLV